jgi:lysophospholipase L1-like esterase
MYILYYLLAVPLMLLLALPVVAKGIWIKPKQSISAAVAAPRPRVQFIQPRIIILYTGDKVEFVGDSQIYYGQQSSGFIDIVRQYNQTYHSQYNFTFHGSGVLAETSTGLLARFDSVLATNPNILCIMTGINDINEAYVYGGWLDRLNLFAANVKEMIDRAKAHGVRQVVLMWPCCWGELPNGWGPYDDKLMVLNTTLYNISLEKDVQYIDCRDQILDAEAMYNSGHQWAGILTSDGVHLNQLGSQLIAGQWIRAAGE